MSHKRFNRDKRIFDRLLVLLSAPVVAPLTAAVALFVRVRVGRPLLYRQVRIGLDEVPFEILKFRTMTNAVDSSGRPLPDADRLTSGGRLLRKLSLDELPQLWNVLRGDMSLVGPRPLYPTYLEFYSESEAKRHLVRPGITGLSQTSGRNHVGWDKRLSLDVDYVNRRSLLLDIRIFADTFRQLMKKSDVAVIAGDTGEPLNIERTYPSTEKFSIRKLREPDLEIRTDWMQHESTRQHMQIDPSLDLESTKAWFASVRHNEARHDFVAINRGTSNPVAMAGLRETKPGSAEFYIFVDPDQRGQGIGFIVSDLVISWALTGGPSDEVTLSVAEANESAVGIYRKLRFQLTDRHGGRLFMSRARPE